MTTRRQFLAASGGSLALLSLSGAAPGLLARAAQAHAAEGGDRVLVMIQLSGGNDGLNTVVPYGDPEYYKNRFTLAIGKPAVIKIQDGLGFHPALSGFSKLLEAGRLAIVQGIGYPQPNRSHFESMDIWHTARMQNEGRAQGWIGRYLDATGARREAEVAGLHLGEEKQPLALASLGAAIPSIQSMDRFRLEAGRRSDLSADIDLAVGSARSSSDDLLSFVQRSTSSALAASRRVEKALAKPGSRVQYPGTGLAQKLKTVAQLIGAGLETRVYYLTLDGFDTHSDQENSHAALLGELGNAVAAFQEDLVQQGQAERVLGVAFSEFGRRVKENASRGTDHGAAAPLFAFGGKVQSGLIGKHPSLTDLDDGDLKFHTDFRRVYATLLDGWLGWPSREILGGEYQPLPIMKS